MRKVLILEGLGVPDPGIMTPESLGDKAEATLCKTSSEPTAYSVLPFLFCSPVSILVLLGGTFIINHFLRTLFSGSASGAPGPPDSYAFLQVGGSQI